MDCSRRRCAAVWLAVTVAAAVLERVAVGELRPPAGPQRFGDLLVSAAALVLVACVAWAWVVTTLVIVSALRRPCHLEPRRLRAVPAGAHRLVLLACGVALLGSVPVGVAHAAPARSAAVSGPTAGTGADAGAHTAATTGATGATAIVGLPLPDRPTGAWHAADPAAPPAAPTPAPATDPATGPASGASVVVAPGDSLWSIAEHLLGPGAGVTEVAGLANRLYELNRASIGSDPDLILPGHQLRTPLGVRPPR